jgi:glutamate-1-semialdehyde 2,1-aminomutase
MTAPASLSPVQAELRTRAAGIFPGGVNSPVRAFGAVGSEPLVINRGKGAYVWDVDGNRYIDLIAGWGPHVLGHAHPAVIDAIRESALDGFAFGASHPLEVTLAERIHDAMPSIERLRFTSSGTEAVMSALRVARAATGRDLVVKFSGAYHGHSDALLADAGSGIATLGIPGSAGVPAAVAATTVVVPFNDPAALDAVFHAHRAGIAAVIVEPIVANAGVIAPAPGFLEHARDVTREAGALLVFDEVITGFRVARGGAQSLLGIEPDLTTLGKVIGGGMPIGAYGGRKELMELVAPAGPVYQAGTLAGHPLSMAAGIATLDQLADERYEDLDARVDELASGLRQAATQTQTTVAIGRGGPLMTLFFLADTPSNAEQALHADRAAYASFFRAMLRRGVLLPPSQFEAWFPGFAHGPSEIQTIVRAASDAFAEIAAE